MTSIQTNWIIIDGAPSSGKTSIVQALHQHGFRIIPEAARAVIEGGMARGKTLEEVRGRQEAFQISVIDTQMQREAMLDPQELLVIDGALPQNVAYIELNQIFNMPNVLQISKKRRYKNIFIFDRLPLKRDHVRVEDEEMAVFLDKKIEEAYRSLNYKPIRIPPVSIKDRLDLVLRHLGVNQKSPELSTSQR